MLRAYCLSRKLRNAATAASARSQDRFVASTNSCNDCAGLLIPLMLALVCVLGGTQGSPTVSINGVQASITSWNDTSIVVVIRQAWLSGRRASNGKRGCESGRHVQSRVQLYDHFRPFDLASGVYTCRGPDYCSEKQLSTMISSFLTQAIMGSNCAYGDDHGLGAAVLAQELQPTLRTPTYLVLPIRGYCRAMTLMPQNCPVSEIRLGAGLFQCLGGVALAVLAVSIRGRRNNNR